MAEQATMIVDKGPDTGKTIRVPEHGLRIGRSSRNDLVLHDPAMSRFHCRVYPVPGKGLFVADLGSSNDTCVNDKPVQETRLNSDDRISIGETVLRVLNDGTGGTAAAAAVGAIAGGGQTRAMADATEPFIDLGLTAPANAGAAGLRRKKTRSVLWLAAMATAGVLSLAALTALGILIWRDLPRQQPPAPEPRAPAPVSLDIYYEKVEANPDNIFRYLMTLDDNRLTIEIDDIENHRQVRKSATLNDSLVRELVLAIESSGFFDLLPEYRGVAPDIHDRSEIRVTIGTRTHRSVVLNRVAPDVFDQVSERLEVLAQNELGTAALALPPEKLREKAHEAYLLGRSLYDERALRHENLYRAIRSFREVEWYLETIEPKPEFYADAVARRQQTERDLEDRLKNLDFLAERAIKGRDWNEAAIHLRTILNTMPDRSDRRHERTVTRLLDVERRLERGL